MIKSKTRARLRFNCSSTTHLDHVMKSRRSPAAIETKNCHFSRNLCVAEQRGLRPPRHQFLPFLSCSPRNRMLMSFSIPNTSLWARLDFFRGNKLILRFCVDFHAAWPKYSLRQRCSGNISDRSAWPCVIARKFRFGSRKFG